MAVIRDPKPYDPSTDSYPRMYQENPNRELRLSDLDEILRRLDDLEDKMYYAMQNVELPD